jgi:hypothetical protein
MVPINGLGWWQTGWTGCDLRGVFLFAGYYELLRLIKWVSL